MNKTDSFLEKKFKWIYWIMLVGAGIMYVMIACVSELWEDEAYSFGLIGHSFSELCKITAADVHPPLYYILLKMFMKPFGENVFMARIFSIIPYMIILLIAGKEIKSLFGEKTTIIFIILFILFPFVYKYAVDIRMYSWSALFVFCNAIYAYRCFERNSIYDWVLFALGGIGAAYLHYFAFVSVLIVYVMLFVTLLIRKRELLKYWIICAAVSAIMYLPWLEYFIEQLIFKVNNEYWIGPVTAKRVIFYAYNVFEVEGVQYYPLLAIPAYICIFINTFLMKDKKVITLSLLGSFVLVGTIGVGVIASIIVRPVFVLRYVVPAIPVFLVGVAVMVSQIKREEFITAFITLSVIGGVSSFSAKILNEYRVPKNLINNSFVERYSDAQCYLLTCNNDFASVLLHYEKDKTIYYRGEVTPANPYKNQKNIREFKKKDNNKTVLMVDLEAEVPKEFLEQYNCEYKETVSTQEIKADVYLLTSIE